MGIPKKLQEKIKFWHWIAGSIIGVAFWLFGRGMMIGEYKQKIDYYAKKDSTTQQQILLITERVHVCEKDITILRAKYEADDEIKADIKKKLEEQYKISVELIKNVAVLNDRDYRK